MHPTLFAGSNFEIPTYFLVLSLAACFSLLWVYRRALQKDMPLKPVLDLSAVVLVFGFIGARLFHIIYEEPAYYLKDPVRVFFFWQGGFVYYGGAFAGVLTGILYYSKFLKLPVSTIGDYLDLFAPVASLGYLIGRMGCFLAGCCYGKSCELPWAIAGRHPTQLYAAFWELGTLIFLLSYEKSKPSPGRVFSLWLVLHGMGRLVMEAFRDDFRGPAFLISISSWISVIVIILGLVAWKLANHPVIKTH